MYASWFQDMAMGFKIFWMFLTYLLWGSVFYTSINIPYGSMASAISPEAKDRASLSSWRTIGATLANVAIGVVLPLVVYYSDANGNTVLSGSRMSLAALGCSIGAVICYLICYHLTTERVKIEKINQSFNLVQLLKSLVTNRALMGIIVAAIMLLLSQLTLSSMGQYIYPNYFGSAAGLSIANGLSSVLTLVLAMIGYTSATAFDAAVLDGIYNITCPVPAAGFVLLALALALALIYPLGKKQVEKNIAYLKEKNQQKDQ